jgi:phospholipid/cholesterol/gamma-HCH transport system substrate-binding protein
MAFKISNETKVGALTAITITAMILGVNFLKGKSPLKRTMVLYARFNAVEGLVPANPVIINGLAVGHVYSLEPGDRTLNSVLVTISLTENLLIPSNSVASILSNPLGTPSVEIVRGDATTYLEAGDTLKTMSASGFLGNVFTKLEPTQRGLNKALGSLDSTLQAISKVVDKQANVELHATLANLRKVSDNLTMTTARLNDMLAAQGSLGKTADNLAAFSKSLADSKEKIPAITANVEQTTKNLSELGLKKTVDDLNATVASLTQVLQKFEQPDNTVGALLHDKKLYNNLTATTNSLNLLLQDLRLQPKRYVNVSVFGKKDKGEPLMKPLAEDSVTQEQLKNK